MTFDQVLELASSPALPAPTDFTFVLGQHPANYDLDEALWEMDNPAFFRPATEGHLVVTGEVGAGKTVLIRGLARQTVETMDVYLYDSWHSLEDRSGTGPAPVSGLAGFAYDIPGAAGLLRTVRDEVRRREHLEAADREDLPRILVLLDDSHCLILDEYSSGAYSDLAAAKAASASCLAMLAEIATARDVGVTLVFASVWGPADAGVPAELIETDLTHVSIQRPYQHPTDDFVPSADRHRPAALTGLTTG